MTELVVVTGTETRRLLFEVEPVERVDGGRGADAEVSLGDWFADRFHAEHNQISIADLSSTILEVAQSTAEGFRRMDADRPGDGSFSEAEVSFGVKVSAEGNAFVAKSGVEAHVSVTLKWKF